MYLIKPLNSGRLLVNGNDFYLGNSTANLSQLALKTDIPSVTQYVHPAEKQCNYTYTHPSSQQCSIPVASSSSDGLMSASDKSKLDGISGSSSALTLVGTRSVTKEVSTSSLRSVGGFLSEDQKTLALAQYHILIINIFGVADSTSGTTTPTQVYACLGGSDEIKFFDRRVNESRDQWFNSSIIMLKETDSWAVPGNSNLLVSQNDIDNVYLYADGPTIDSREWRFTHSIYGI